MTTPPRVHIRMPVTLMTYCGAIGESMSLDFWFEHVVPNRDGCCHALYRRLCVKCDHLIPHQPPRT